MNLKSVIIAALLAAAAGSAHAAEVCTITDTLGNDLTYEFGPNTNRTMVETSFTKNGRTTVSDVGTRPVWTWVNDQLLRSQEAPGWSINMESGTLIHNGRVAGTGWCGEDASKVAGPVGDQGIVQ
jgi:hypothetical protein